VIIDSKKPFVKGQTFVIILDMSVEALYRLETK